MASVYPGALDNLALGDAPTNLIGPDVEDLKDATNKIEAELGVAPSGAHPTVKSRLDALVAVFDTYTVTHTATLRTLNENTATINNIVDFLGTLIDDYKALT